MANDLLKIGDRVDWADTDDPQEKKNRISWWGPGPFQIYKTEMENGRQFVVLACKDHGKLLVLDSNLDLLIPADDPEAESITPRIPSNILKKI